MKKIALKVTVLSFVLLVSSLSIIAQTDYSSLKDEFRKEIEKKMKKSKVKGASIALIKGDSIIWSEAFGYADAENKIEATTETQYRVGSVTKLFTGIAVMQLQEQGKLNIDEPLRKFLPEFNIKSRFGSIDEITPRNVMTHTAGIPCDLMRGFVSEQPESYRKEIEYLNKEYAIYAPNTVHAYSNPGYNLLGCMVEDVAEVPYKEYVKQNIFDPLQMNNTYFMESDAPRLAAAYDSKGKPAIEYAIREVPAGEIKSTVLDLSKFISAHLTETKRVLSKDSQEEMTKTQFDQLYEGAFSKIGLTWFIRETEGYSNIYEHGGATLYHRAKVAICPEQNLGVVILTNSSRGGSVTVLSTKILKKAIDLEIGKPELAENDNKEKVSFTKENISETELNKYNGFYALPGAIYEVTTKGNKLTAKIQGFKINMRYDGDNEFMPVLKLLGFIPIKMKNERFIFDTGEDETIIYQRNVKRNGLGIVGQSFEKQEISSAWKNRIGKYKVVNGKPGDRDLFANMELVEDNGVLILNTTVTLDGEQNMQMGLGIISDDLAYVLGKGRQGGYSVAVEQDENGEDLLRFSGYLLKKE